ncbi:MAG: hypothetical protein V4449_02425 [Patescibacteria group bacterium]
MNKKIIVGIVVVVLLAGSFYGGMVYGKSSTPVRGQFGNGQFSGNPAGMGGMRAGMGGGLTAGEIISKDATSVTIKMQDGSTKIVLIGESTQVMKTSAGSADDLSVGTNVAVTGTTNSDGSITGQSVQIRPAGSAPLGGTPPIAQ